MSEKNERNKAQSVAAETPRVGNPYYQPDYDESERQFAKAIEMLDKSPVFTAKHGSTTTSACWPDSRKLISTVEKNRLGSQEEV